ncbi:DUF4132 domain-containing protein [Actinophytocola sp.]|uniref:DUF4132 domain-containing protein n=1 Tax=Actinophytocola sp. TaxID=1872138 RepID=UPI002ED69482
MPSPDEDTFVIPTSWRRLVHPRRDGVPGPALKVDRAVARGLIADVRERVDDFLAGLTKELDAGVEALAYVESGGTEGTPRGAAVIATAVARYATEGDGWRRAGQLASFVDTWVVDRGLDFAVRAVVEYERTSIGWRGNPRQPNYYLTPVEPGAKGERRVKVDPIVARMRAHLAAAGEKDHVAAIDALAEHQPEDPLLAAFLVPERADWVAAAPGGSAMWLCAVGSVDARLPGIPMYVVGRQPATLLTLVAATGPAIAPTLAHWFDLDYVLADDQKRLLAALAALPTDEAFEILVRRLDRKYVRQAVIEATKRFPVRAARLLAEAAGAESPIRSLAEEVLRTHFAAHPELVGPDLPAPALTTPAATDDDTLPPLLANPPWTRGRTTAKPVVIDLVSDEDVTVSWQAGEQKAWAATRGWVPSAFDRRSWDELFNEFLTGSLPDYLEPGLFGAGPEEWVRQLLPNWRPDTLWRVGEWLKSIVARYELDALPLTLYAADLNPAQHTTELGPYASAEVAELMMRLFRLKSARRGALAWLDRHPRAAARYLIPAALSKPGKERQTAEAMLRLVPADDVRAAAAAYGDQVETAMTAMLATDPLDVLPARIPKVPDWAEPAVLPTIVLRDGGPLPATAVRHVLTMLAMSRPGEVYAGVEEVKRLCEPGSLAEFAWGLFQCWQKAGMPAKDSWALDALGWFGDDETVRRFSPVIRAWPGEGAHARAVNGLDVLATIGTDVALMHLYGIAQKVKFKGLKAKAQEKIAEVAAELELSPDQLGDRLVPDLGLDAGGSLTLDYGRRRFVVGFDEALRPYVADEDGTRRKSLPKPAASDDQDLAPAAYARFTALKKDARTIAADQVRRFEQAMVSGRRWTVAEFAELFVAHPLLWHIVRRLVWADFAGGVTAFRVAEDRTYADVHDDTLVLPESASVGIAHPLHLAGTLPAWTELFADYEILQPFPQLGRAVHALTADEETATRLDRFEQVTVPTVKVLGLTRRGWQRATPQDAGVEPWIMRPLPGGRAVVLNLDPGVAVGAVDEFPEQRIDAVWLSGTGDGDWSPQPGPRFGELDAVTASEVLGDLIELTAVT